MPVSYIRELSKLQDSAPATHWSEIQHLLPKSLKRDLVHVETTPIASASIGQVHVATIRVQNDDRSGGGKAITTKKVVIKIQHPHARTLMMDDFWSLMVICRVVGWLEPDYKFMEILMREWAIEAKKELDFHNEAHHLQLARSAIQGMFYDNNFAYTNTTNVPFQVEIPQPLTEYSNQRVLVMEYCDGCRVDNFAQLQAWNLQRQDIMDGLSQTFAYMMYQSSIFNGDPHPGKLL
jgi:predicted unusual protein kinase regulating ubiquinone biosynthesis (AarF/ABC1/UbiB family)